jgi:hypothetical protein
MMGAGSHMNADWQMSEQQLLSAVCALLEERALLWLHMTNVHHNARRGHAHGFPDLLICGPGGQIFRELKTMRGASTGVTGSQVDWKYALIEGGANWAVWSPADLSAGRITAQLDQLAVASSR